MILSQPEVICNRSREIELDTVLNGNDKDALSWAFRSIRYWGKHDKVNTEIPVWTRLGYYTELIVNPSGNCLQCKC